MPNTSLAETIVTNLGGDWHERKGFGLCPGPGHSKGDRSLLIAPHKDNPEDVFVFSFSGDDVLALKKKWREGGLLARFGRSELIEVKSAKGKAASSKSNANDADNAEERRENARWLHDQCSPAGGSVVQKYLHSRRIALDPCPGRSAICQHARLNIRIQQCLCRSAYRMSRNRMFTGRPVSASRAFS